MSKNDETGQEPKKDKSLEAMSSKQDEKGAMPTPPDPTVKKKEPRKPLKFTEMYAFRIMLMIIGVWMGFQILIMWIYVTFPAVDWLVNRFSWSDSQALGLAAIFVAVYGMKNQEQYLWTKFGIRMGSAKDIKSNAEEVEGEKVMDTMDRVDKLLERVEPIFRWLEPIAQELDDEYKSLSEEDKKRIVDELRAEIKKKVNELKAGKDAEIPPPDGRFADDR